MVNHWARHFVTGLSSFGSRLRSRLAGSRFNPSRWRKPSDELPPLHNQVLVAIKGGAGFVADVACFIGKQDDGTGKQIDRWILADVRLETRQITHWKPIVGPV